MVFSKITSKGQITIPNVIRNRLKLKAGDKVEFRIGKDGSEVYFVPSKNLTKDVFGILADKRKGNSLSVEAMNEAIKKRMKVEKK